MKNPGKMVAVSGLALGGVFGLLGTFVGQRNLQSAAWGIDGTGLVVATALLSLKFFRKDNDIVAAGFLVFAIGEAVMLAGTAKTLADSVPSFAAGTALWSAELFLTSVPRQFAVWTRLAGIVGGILFAITSARISGEHRFCPRPRRCPFSPIRFSF